MAFEQGLDLDQAIQGALQPPVSEEQIDAMQRAQVAQALREIRARDIDKEVRTLMEERQAEVEDEIQGIFGDVKKSGKQRSSSGIGRSVQNQFQQQLQPQLSAQDLLAFGGQQLPL